jgi:drug/metabolite transporter (DMT)-like permease
MHEAFSLNKFIGVIFTVAAGAILTFSSKGIYSKQGILYALSATGIYAIVIQLYGPLLKEFNAPTLTFFIFLIPTLLNALCMPNSLHRIAALWSIHRYTLLFACAAGGLANVCMNSALSSGNATQTLVIIESFLIVTLVGEHVLLHEQDNLMKKCISVLLAIIGAVLLKIA